jgi:hypothetical protein
MARHSGCFHGGIHDAYVGQGADDSINAHAKRGLRAYPTITSFQTPIKIHSEYQHEEKC